MPPHWAALGAAGAPGPPALPSLPSATAPSLLSVLAAQQPCPPAQTALCVLFSNLISHFSPTHPRPFHCVFRNSWASLVAQTVKRLSAMQETQVRSLGWEDPLEKEMAAHSSILAWKIPWTVEPGRLPSMGSQRVGHD